VQRAELRDDKEQKEHAEQIGVQEVLPSLPLPHAASRKQVVSNLGMRIKDSRTSWHQWQ